MVKGGGGLVSSSGLVFLQALGYGDRSALTELLQGPCNARLLARRLAPEMGGFGSDISKLGKTGPGGLGVQGGEGEAQSSL